MHSNSNVASAIEAGVKAAGGRVIKITNYSFRDGTVCEYEKEDGIHTLDVSGLEVLQSDFYMLKDLIKDRVENA